MTTIKVSKVRTVTYLGRRVTVATVGSQGTGRRVAVSLYVDQADPRNGGHAPGVVELRECQGDGRNGTFVKLSEEFMPVGTTIEQAIERAKEVLS